jgi:Ca2+:H+ antiporter
MDTNAQPDWLEGILLMASYIIIAVAAWFYPEIAENQC